MALLLRHIILGGLGLVLGFIVVWKSTYIVDSVTGPNAWAEETLGGAGTYTFIKILGFLIMIIALLYMTGMLTNMGMKLIEFTFGSGK